MKVIGFNGSPRKDGNTTALIGYLLREIEKEGIETELVQLSAKTIQGALPATNVSRIRTSNAPLRTMRQTNISKKLRRLRVSFWDLLPIFRMSQRR